MTIRRFFSTTDVQIACMADFLDALDPLTRSQEIRSLGRTEQAALFEAAAGFRPVELNDFVPDGTAPLEEIVHHGRNSLPLLSRFEKRFCRPEERAEELWGYNEFSLKRIVGPGYFIARRRSETEVVIDYTEVPPTRPQSWPRIVPNSVGLGRFVYQGLRDTIRGVSRHVTIGRAARGGRPLDNWFVLCRAVEPDTTGTSGRMARRRTGPSIRSDTC